MSAEKTVTQYECSDGETFTDKLDAEIHEGRVGLKSVCDKHGYSSSHFDRDDLCILLVQHATEFRDALTAYVVPLSVKRARESQGR